MCTIQHRPSQMTTTLSVRIDTDTKKRLEALAKRARRSQSFLAAEAIAAFVEAESWQLDEIQKGFTELDEGRGVPHKDVEKWLRPGLEADDIRASMAYAAEMTRERIVVTGRGVASG